jgi:hypothetical protein
VFDTAPGYGASEEVAAKAINELGVRDRLFWATKLNVAGRGQSADPARARQQVDTSLERFGGSIDLIQVHNVADMATQFPILEEYKQAGRVRYIGTTSTFKPQYETLEQLMRDEPLDFIGIDYAVDNQDAAERIFPLAQERGIGVLVYVPFGRTRLWQRVEGHEVPAWAGEFGASTRIVLTTSRYMLGNLAISVICGTVYGVTAVILDVPYPLALAVIAGVLDLIPNIGATIAGVIVGIAALSVSLGAFIVFLIVIVVYQQIENYILQPTIIGRAAWISGFTVLASVLAFGALFGLVGAIIGVPIAAGLQIVVEEFTAARRARIAAVDTAG